MFALSGWEISLVTADAFTKYSKLIPRVEKEICSKYPYQKLTVLHTDSLQFPCAYGHHSGRFFFPLCSAEDKAQVPIHVTGIELRL